MTTVAYRCRRCTFYAVGGEGPVAALIERPDCCEDGDDCLMEEVYLCGVGEAAGIPEGWDTAWYGSRHVAIPAPEAKTGD